MTYAQIAQTLDNLFHAAAKALIPAALADIPAESFPVFTVQAQNALARKVPLDKEGKAPHAKVIAPWLRLDAWITGQAGPKRPEVNIQPVNLLDPEQVVLQVLGLLIHWFGTVIAPSKAGPTSSRGGYYSGPGFDAACRTLGVRKASVKDKRYGRRLDVSKDAKLEAVYQSLLLIATEEAWDLHRPLPVEGTAPTKSGSPDVRYGCPTCGFAIRFRPTQAQPTVHLMCSDCRSALVLLEKGQKIADTTAGDHVPSAPVEAINLLPAEVEAVKALAELEELVTPAAPKSRKTRKVAEEVAA